MQCPGKLPNMEIRKAGDKKGKNLNYDAYRSSAKILNPAQF